MQILSIVVLILFSCIPLEITEEYNLASRRIVQHSKLFSCLYGDLLHSDEADPLIGGTCVPNMSNERKGTGTTSCSTSSADEPTESLERNNPRLKAASIAQNAAQVAKAANEAQSSAAQDAAKQVKMQLAEKAIQASRAAEAALEGKQVIVDNYEREIREADAIVRQMSSSLESSEANAENAQLVVEASECQLNNLKALMKQTTSSLSDVESLGQLAHSDVEEKTQMLAAAKARANHLIEQVAQAKEDYECVKELAYRAASATLEAKQKATSSSTIGDRGECPSVPLAPYCESKNHSKGNRESSVRNGRWFREMIRGDAIRSPNKPTFLHGRHFYRKCLESNFVNPD